MGSRPAQAPRSCPRPAPPPPGPRAPETSARDRACAGARQRFLGTRARRSPGGGLTQRLRSEEDGRGPPSRPKSFTFSALAAPKLRPPGAGLRCRLAASAAPSAGRPLEAPEELGSFSFGAGKGLELAQSCGVKPQLSGGIWGT